VHSQVGFHAIATNREGSVLHTSGAGEFSERCLLLPSSIASLFFMAAVGGVESPRVKLLAALSVFVDLPSLMAVVCLLYSARVLAPAGRPSSLASSVFRAIVRLWWHCAAARTML